MGRHAPSWKTGGAPPALFDLDVLCQHLPTHMRPPKGRSYVISTAHVAGRPLLHLQGQLVMANKQADLPSITPVSESITQSQTLQFRSAYSPRKRVAVTPRGESLTKQSFKDECDINILMSKYQATGMLDHLNPAEPRFADVSAMDYQRAMDTVADARSLFHALPSAIRDRFGNDPQRLLEFADDPRNADEALELGFLDKARLEALRQSQGAATPLPSTSQTAPPQAPETEPKQ